MITFIGLLAGTLTTVCYLPQVIKIWRTRETKDISLLMYVTVTGGVALWLIYGILIDNWVITIVNAVTLVLSGSVLILKIKHG